MGSRYWDAKNVYWGGKRRAYVADRTSVSISHCISMGLCVQVFGDLCSVSFANTLLKESEAKVNVDPQVAFALCPSAISSSCNLCCILSLVSVLT